MTNCRLCAPLLRSGIDAPLGKVAVAPVGRPELTDSATVLGIFPPSGVADVKLAGMEFATLSLRVTPVVRSPVLVIVYLKVTGLPMPTTQGGVVHAVAVMVRFTVGPSLPTNASVGPWSAL